MDVNENFFNYNGNLLRFLTIGEGDQEVILMHGYHYNAEIWLKTKTADTFIKNNFTCYLLDMPDFPNSQSKFKTDENGIIKLIESFSENYIGDKFTLLGASISGYLAIKYAIEYQQKLNKLILIGPSDVPNTNVQISSRTLLLYGSKDPLIKYSDALKNLIPNQTLYIIQGAGHSCYLDKPHEFNSIIEKFINDQLN